MRLAFKSAAEAARRESNPLAKIFSEGIARVTGGEYSHVEIWLDGPITQARCFSSREPVGTGFAIIDLSDTALWQIVDVPELLVDIRPLDAADYAWCQGRAGRPYSFPNIIAIGLGKPFCFPGTDFCSQCAVEFLQDRRGMFMSITETDWIAPSGYGTDGKRYGLYELMTGAQKLP